MYNKTSNMEVLTTDNPVFNCYILCVCLLIIKMIVMSFLTGFMRSKHKAYINPEDAAAAKHEVVENNEDVERVRRAHLNDLENIPIFFFAALLYIFTKPPVILAFVLFISFTIVRYVHTIIYAILKIGQPYRAIMWSTGVLITCFLTIRTMIYAIIKLA